MSKIFCYSATGNSLYAAKKIAEKINAEVLPMSKDTSIVEDKIIGFVFPVFYWGLPKLVENFAQNLKIANKNAYIFSVATYGGGTFGESGYLKKILNQKECRLSFCAKVKAVENYILNYKVNNKPKIHEKFEKKLSKIIEKIKAQKENKSHKTFLNDIIHSFYLKKSGSLDKGFSVSENCSGCGVCEKICPSENVKIKNNKPEFLHNCGVCLACIHACPKAAINLNKTYKKERYLNPNIKLEELIKLNDN